MKKQQGFTLIELIIVIIILGILAVTAAPKFIDIKGDASAAQLQGLRGAVNGAMTLTYSKSAIQGEEATAKTAGTPPEVGSVLTSFGYPTADIAEVADAAGFDVTDFAGVADASTTPDEVVFYPAGSLTAPTKAQVIAAGCYVLYTEAADADTAATVAIVLTGATCS